MNTPSYTNCTILLEKNLKTPRDVISLENLPNSGDFLLSEHNGIFRFLYAIHDSRQDTLSPEIYLVCVEADKSELPDFQPVAEIEQFEER